MDRKEVTELQDIVNDIYCKTEKIYDMIAEIRGMFTGDMPDVTPPAVELDYENAVASCFSDGVPRFIVVDTEGNNLGAATLEYIKLVQLPGYLADNCYYLTCDLGKEIKDQIIKDLSR